MELMLLYSDGLTYLTGRLFEFYFIDKIEICKISILRNENRT